MNTPKITILEYELIVNRKLYETGVITEKQFEEANKIIYENISYYTKTKELS